MAGEIQVSDEAVRVAAEAIEDEAIRHIGRDLGTVHRDDIVRAGLAAALPLLRKQWEGEMSECDESVIPPMFFADQSQRPPVPCARKPLGHPLPHRAADGMEWWPIGDAADA